MSTRARIGLELSDGSVLSVYHHWSGYPEWLGRILKTHYNSKELAAELIDSGDMSVCWTDERWYGNGEEFRTFTGVYGPNYYSLRGDDCPPRIDVNLIEYLGDNEEFAYLFTNGEWVCYELGETTELIEIPSGAADDD